MADEKVQPEGPVSLDELKTMLQLKTDSMNATLDLIIKNTVAQTRFKLGLVSEEKFPSELNYIPLEVCVRRYNRLKNEGMSQYRQEGESITFDNTDFDDFLDDIAAWRRQREGKSLGNVRFVNPYRGDNHANG